MSAPSRNPLEELERLFERMSRQYGGGSDRPQSDGSIGWFGTELEPMSVDIVERDDEYVVTVDLPGFEKEDVSLQLADETLRIEADREETGEEADGEYIRRERRHESVRRSIRLPESVDSDGVTARMNNGVLTVTLEKPAVEDAESIDIE